MSLDPRPRWTSAFRLSLAAVGAWSLVFAGAMPASGAASESDRYRVAATVGPSAFELSVVGPPTATELVVSGPEGVAFRQVFESGASPRFPLHGPNGAALKDGIYVWELRSVAESRRVRTEQEAGGLSSLAIDPGPLASGGFSIRDGIGVQSGTEERGLDLLATGREFRPDPNAAGGALAPFDQVIPDDLIVQGSACVGFDCVNNESFGFDTIRLKENNLQIKFEDTSVGSFPSNDWLLRANDSASGGPDRFTLEDVTGSKVPLTVTAGAPTNSIFVASNGKLGLRTSTPVLDLHFNTSDTPALRFEQNGSGGFTPQTWDVAGNEANFFVRDVTGGSLLPFRIRPGAPTSSIDIASNGNVGIGVAGASAKLQVNGGDVLIRKTLNATNTQIGVVIESTGGSVDSSWTLRNNPTSGALLISDNPAGQAPFKIFPSNSQDLLVLRGNRLGIGGVSNPTDNIQHASGARLVGGNWTNASSRELKTAIHDLSTEAALAALAGLQPVTFAYKSNPDDQQVGFIAEDVPELVATIDHRGLSAMDVVAVLTGVVKRQQADIDILKARLAELEGAAPR